MSKGNKILNYIVMVCAIMSSILFCIDKNWDAALWAFIAFIWVVNCHFTEESYEELAELTKEYVKEIKKLKDEIEKMIKGK